MKKVTVLFMLMWLLAGCIFSSESQQAREVAENFWTAVQGHNKEKTKDLSTWNSVEYLRFLSNEKFVVQRFETGEVKIENSVAEVATVIYSGEKNEMPIPLRTILVKAEDGSWKVNVKKTMGSMVNGVMDAAVGELNTFMQKGLKGLDQTLSENLDNLGKSLEDSVKQLQRELNTK